MPHINIKCYPGRTEEQKQKCALAVAKAVSEIMGCDISHVSLEINEIDKSDWEAKVWDKEIEPNMDKLYIKPGYNPKK